MKLGKGLPAWVPNKDFADEFSREPGCRSGLAGEARRLAAEVGRAAPKRTGFFAGSIRTTVVFDLKTRTPVDVVYTSDPFGHLVEWGSANNPPFAPFRRGVSAAGMRLKEDPKP